MTDYYKIGTFTESQTQASGNPFPELEAGIFDTSDDGTIGNAGDTVQFKACGKAFARYDLGKKFQEKFKSSLPPNPTQNQFKELAQYLIKRFKLFEKGSKIPCASGSASPQPRQEVVVTLPGSLKQLQDSGLLEGLTVKTEEVVIPQGAKSVPSGQAIVVTFPKGSYGYSSFSRRFNGVSRDNNGKVWGSFVKRGDNSYTITVKNGYDIQRILGYLRDETNVFSGATSSNIITLRTKKPQPDKYEVKLTFDQAGESYFKFKERFEKGQQVRLYDLDNDHSNRNEVYLTRDLLARVMGELRAGGLNVSLSGEELERFKGIIDSWNFEGVDVSTDEKLRAALAARLPSDGVEVYVWDKDGNSNSINDTYFADSALYTLVNSVFATSPPLFTPAPASSGLEMVEYFGQRVPLLHELNPLLFHYKYRILLTDRATGRIGIYVPLPGGVNASPNPNHDYNDVAPGIFTLSPEILKEWSLPTEAELKVFIEDVANRDLFPLNVTPSIGNIAKSNQIHITRTADGKFVPVIATFSHKLCGAGMLGNVKVLDIPMTDEQIYKLAVFLNITALDLLEAVQQGICLDNSVTLQKAEKDGQKYIRFVIPEGLLKQRIDFLEKAIRGVSGSKVVLDRGVVLDKEFAEALLEALIKYRDGEITWDSFTNSIEKWIGEHPLVTGFVGGLITGLIIAGAISVGPTIAHGLIPPLRRMRSRTTAREQVEASMYKRAMDARREPGEIIELYTEDLVRRARGIGTKVTRRRVRRDLVELVEIEDRLKPKQGMEAALEEVFRHWLQIGKHSFVTVGDAGGGKSALQEAAAIEIAKRQVIEEFLAREETALNRNFWSPEIMRTYKIDPGAELTSTCPRALMNKRILRLKVEEFVAGTQWRGDLEDRIKDLIRALSVDPVHNTLGIEEIADNFQAGRSEGGEGVGKQLKPAMAEGRVGVWGNAVHEDYKRTIGKDRQAARRLPIQRLGNTAREVTDLIIELIARDQMEHLRRLDPDFRKAGVQLEFSDTARSAVMDRAAEFYAQAEPDRSIDLTKRIVTEMYMEWERAQRRGEASRSVTMRGDTPTFVVTREYAERYVTEYLQHPKILEIRDEIEEVLSKLRREHFVRAEELGVREEIFTRGEEEWGKYKRRLERLLEALNDLKAKLDGGASGPFGGQGRIPAEQDVRTAIQGARDTFDREGRSLTDRPVDQGPSIAERLARIAELERGLINSIIKFASETLIDPAELGIPDAETFEKIFQKRVDETWDEYRARFERVQAAFDRNQEALKSTDTTEEAKKARENAKAENQKMFGVYRGDTQDRSANGRVREAEARIRAVQEEYRARKNPNQPREGRESLYKTWETTPAEALRHTEEAYRSDLSRRQVADDLPEAMQIPAMRADETPEEYRDRLEKEALPECERQRDARAQIWEKAYEAEQKRLAEKAVREGKASPAVIAFHNGSTQEVPPSIAQQAKRNVDGWGEVLFGSLSGPGLRNGVKHLPSGLKQHYRALAEGYKARNGSEMESIHQLAEMVDPVVRDSVLAEMAAEGKEISDKPERVVFELVAKDAEMKSAWGERKAGERDEVRHRFESRVRRAARKPAPKPLPVSEPPTPPRAEAALTPKLLETTDLLRLFPNLKDQFNRRQARSLKNALLSTAGEAERVILDRLYPGDSLPKSALDVADSIVRVYGPERAAAIFSRTLLQIRSSANGAAIASALVKSATAHVRDQRGPDAEERLMHLAELRYRELLERRADRGDRLAREEARRVEQLKRARERARARQRSARPAIPLP